VRDLNAEGAQISVQAVARRAGVSRQWLYTQPALRAQIERLRDRAPAAANGVPTRQRATEASLRQRLEMLRGENQRLREENASLKTELAIAYGQQRQAGGA
jgi:transposase-like protein